MTEISIVSLSLSLAPPSLSLSLSLSPVSQVLQRLREIIIEPEKKKRKIKNKTKAKKVGSVVAAMHFRDSRDTIRREREREREWDFVVLLARAVSDPEFEMGRTRTHGYI